jgi:hypothetical protein
LHAQVAARSQSRIGSIGTCADRKRLFLQSAAVAQLDSCTTIEIACHFAEGFFTVSIPWDR